MENLLKYTTILINSKKFQYSHFQFYSIFPKQIVACFMEVQLYEILNFIILVLTKRILIYFFGFFLLRFYTMVVLSVNIRVPNKKNWLSEVSMCLSGYNFVLYHFFLLLTSRPFDLLTGTFCTLVKTDYSAFLKRFIRLSILWQSYGTIKYGGIHKKLYLR